MAANDMTQTLSVNEAACVTGVPLEQVQRYIDAGFPGVTDNGDAVSRNIRFEALVGLKLAYETTDMLTPNGCRRMMRYLLENPQARTVRERQVSVDVRPMKSEIQKGLAKLAKVR